MTDIELIKVSCYIGLGATLIVGLCSALFPKEVYKGIIGYQRKWKGFIWGFDPDNPPEIYFLISRIFGWLIFSVSLFFLVGIATGFISIKAFTTGVTIWKQAR